jgi:hypothetical protein
MQQALTDYTTTDDEEYPAGDTEAHRNTSISDVSIEEFTPLGADSTPEVTIEFDRDGRERIRIRVIRPRALNSSMGDPGDDVLPAEVEIVNETRLNDPAKPIPVPRGIDTLEDTTQHVTPVLEHDDVPPAVEAAAKNLITKTFGKSD